MLPVLDWFRGSQNRHRPARKLVPLRNRSEPLNHDGSAKVTKNMTAPGNSSARLTFCSRDTPTDIVTAVVVVVVAAVVGDDDNVDCCASLTGKMNLLLFWWSS